MKDLFEQLKFQQLVVTRFFILLLSSYTAGYTLATVWLHLWGVGIALFIKRHGHIQWLRLTGMIVAGYGAKLLLAG